MKRASFLLGFAIFALFIFSNSGTEAITPTFADRFAAADKDKDKKDKDTTDYSGAYTFDTAHSAIGFRVKHMGLVDVLGFFREFSGTVNYNQKDPAKSTVEFTAKTASVDTANKGRDAHLRRADFFDAEKFPDITFKSTKVVKNGKKGFTVTGDFTLRGVTKTITFPFNIAGFIPGNDKGGPKMGVTAGTSINRRDYGVNYGGDLPNGVAMLSDNVAIDLQVELNGPKPVAAAGGAPK